jgi:hypothetical protein
VRDAGWSKGPGWSAFSSVVIEVFAGSLEKWDKPPDLTLSSTCPPDLSMLYALPQRYSTVPPCPLIKKIPPISSIFEHIGQFPTCFSARMGYFDRPSQPILANGR